jgi:SAM-dependent methyltransferase
MARDRLGARQISLLNDQFAISCRAVVVVGSEMSVISRGIRALRRINLAVEPTLRHAWVYLRAVYFIRVRGRLRTLEGKDVVKANIMHNLKSIYGANNRMNLLLYPVSVIETANRESRILVIGPRNENDLYSLVGLGYNLEKIHGLDLISYSPHIELGDMHEIPYAGNSFDIVICGWTLSYSTNPLKAAQEMVRVAKPGGLIAVGVEYSEMSPEDERKLVGYEIQELGRIGSRINSTEQILKLFGASAGTVFFSHDAPMKVSHSANKIVDNVSNVGVVFRLVAPKVLPTGNEHAN